MPLSPGAPATSATYSRSIAWVRKRSWSDVERRAAAREDERARGVLVEAVNDPGVRPAAVPMLEVVERPRPERVLLARLGRNREQARGLVDDEHVGRPRTAPSAGCARAGAAAGRDGRRAARRPPPPGRARPRRRRRRRRGRSARPRAPHAATGRTSARPRGRASWRRGGAGGLRDGELDEEFRIADSRSGPGSGPERGRGPIPRARGGVEVPEVVPSEGRAILRPPRRRWPGEERPAAARRASPSRAPRPPRRGCPGRTARAGTDCAARGRS